VHGVGGWMGFSVFFMFNCAMGCGGSVGFILFVKVIAW
jgi:hypothetical protein